MKRKAEIVRETTETQIKLQLDLDGQGEYQIRTGVGFLDHMLSQVAHHGLFNLKVEASGDLEIDAHHLIEDCGISLGMAFDEALEDRAGIVRAGHAWVPMDETLAFCAIDFSGRPYAVCEAEWTAPLIGALPTEMVEHFFQSWAVAARATIHTRIITGRNDHHKAEGLFKAFARALDAACRVDPRRSGVPSTKGTLG
jgi:imidazoleglycerol-phosphate dehydratase